MTRSDLADELSSFLLSEFVEVQHPFDLSNPSKTYRFGNTEFVVDIFLRFLSHECDEERLKAVGTDFYVAFQQFNDAKYTETDKRSLAVQALAVKFEAFLKKIAYYRYPTEKIWHHGLDTLLKGAVLSLQSNLKQRDVSYWEDRPVRDAIIRDLYHLRHPSAHEAWKRSSVEIDRYAHSVIAAYLFVVAENLEILRNAVSPETASNFIAEYLEDLAHDNRFRVWRSAYTSLTVFSRDSIDECLVPFDLVLSELVEDDDKADETTQSDEIAFGEMEEERGPVEQIVDRYSHLVIVGDAGAGKTTILQRLALLHSDYALSQMASGTADFIAPIYVELSTYRDSLLDLIRITLKIDSTHQLLDFLRDGRFILLLDGLNEVASNRYRDALNDIKRFMAEFSSNHYIITCRKEGYHNDLGIKTFEVDPLTNEQIREYLTRYMGRDRGEILWDQLRILSANLGRNPLILSMVVRVFSERDSIPENRADLFRQFVEWMYAREERKGQQTSRVLKEDVLIDLGYQMQLSGEVSIQETVARDNVAVVLDNLHERTVSPSGLLAELVDNGFLTRLMPDGVRYFHQLAQEYFAALAVQRLLNQDLMQLEILLADRGWDEILVMLAGLAETSDSVVTALLREGRLRLATRCFSAGKNTSPHTESALFHRLEEGVNASDVDELLVAITALSEIRTNRACRLLKTAVQNSVDLSAGRGKLKRPRRKLLRSQLAQAIDNYDFSTFESFLEKLVTDSKTKKGSLSRISFILFMVSHLTHDDSGPFLLKMMRSSNSKLATCAAQAIGCSGREDLVPELVELADSDSPSIRARVAVCLSSLVRLSPSHVQDTLVRLSQDSNQQVARRAIAGLAFVSDISEAVTLLLRASKSDHDAVRRSAASAMGNLDVSALEERGLLPAVVGRLKDLLLGDTPRPTRRRAARSLGRMGTPLCMSILQQAILDPRRQVQSVAVEGLWASGGRSRLNQREIQKLATIIAVGRSSNKVRQSAARLLVRHRAYQVLPYLEGALEREFLDARTERPIRYALRQLRRGQAADTKVGLSTDLSGENELSSSTPFEPHVFRQYAKLLTRQRRYREVKEVSELIVDRVGSPDDLRHYARLLSIVGREADAERAFQTAMRLSPDNTTVKRDFAYFLIKSGRGGEAYQILRPLVSTAGPDKARVTLSFAAALDILGRTEEAESTFWAAVQDWGDNPLVHNALANYLKEHGRLLEAEQQYLAAINLAPLNGVFANNYGMLLMQKGDYKAAEVQFIRAIQLDSAFPWPYFHLAALCASQNRLGEIVKSAIRGIRCFLQYEDYENSLYLARFVCDGKDHNVVDKHLLAEFGIVATSLALLSASSKHMVSRLLENAESILQDKPLRPLLAGLHNTIARKLAQSSNVGISSTPPLTEFAQVQELADRSTLWYAEKCYEILGVFSEQADDWNLVIAGLIVDLHTVDSNSV